MSYRQTLQGATGYLQSVLAALLAPLNEELAAKVQSDDPPVFRLVVGDPGGVGLPTIALYADSGQNSDLAQRTDKERVYMVVVVIIPTVGDNSPSQFEMTKQVALDMIKDALSTLAGISPNTVFSSDGATWRGIRAQWSNWASLWPDRLPDKVTIAHRYELRWWIDYQIDLS